MTNIDHSKLTEEKIAKSKLRLADLIRRYNSLEFLESVIFETFEVLFECFRSGNKLLICGNGGSASDSDHMATELLKGFCKKRHLPFEWHMKLGNELATALQNALPVIPLPNMVGLMTAFMNDCNPDYVFAQLTWALGNPGDTLLCISTSGNAKNVAYAAKVAKAKDMKIIGLSGKTGGMLKPLTDICICTPETEAYKIQEYHLPIYHTLCLMLEEAFFDN